MSVVLDPPEPPQLKADFTTEVEDDGHTVTFDASLSRPNVVSYDWDYGDGSGPGHFSDSPRVTYGYLVEDTTTVTITLTVTDADGLTATATHDLELEEVVPRISGLNQLTRTRFFPAT